MEDFKTFKQDTKDDINKLDKKVDKLDLKIDKLQENMTQMISEMSKSNHNLEILIYEKFVKKDELEKVENDMNSELQKVEKDINTKINHIDGKLKTHIKEEKDNRWKICGLAIGVPTFILAFIEVLKNLLN